MILFEGKMMKKINAILILVFILSVSSVFASGTRVLTMGDNNMILLDEENIFLFPSRIYEWPNLIVSEFGDNDLAYLGTHWKFGKKDKSTYLATYFYNNSPAAPILANSPFYNDPYNLGYNFGFSESFIPFDNSLLSNQRFDIIYGRKYNSNHIGVQFGITNSSMENDIPTLGFPNDGQDKESYTVYSINSGLTMNDGNVDLAFGVDVMTFENRATDTQGNGYNESRSNGNYMIHFAGRSFRSKSKQYTFIPHFNINYSKYEAEYFDNYFPDSNVIYLAEDNKYTRTNVDIGIGVQYTPSKKVLTVLDFGFIYDKLKGEFASSTLGTNEASVKTFSLPYFKLGFDATVFKWMDIRLGATSDWKNETWENSANNSEHIRKFADNNTYLGFGFHWGQLHVDTWTDPEMFLRGFDFINGKDNNDDMNFGMSIIYEM